MGKRQVRVIVVSRRITAALLAVTSAVMVASVYALAGRAYVTDANEVRGLVRTLLEAERPSANSLLVIAMPLVANALIFVPWGFLAFVTLDRPSRPRRSVYALTLLSGLVFALAIDVWQAFLPTRVTGHADVFANVAGALVGALAGHLRKQVRVNFET